MVWGLYGAVWFGKVWLGMTSSLPAVMLVDDHPLFRQGLRMMLSTSQVIRAQFFEAGSVAEAVEHQARVDLVLLDISMPGGDGVTGIARVRQRWPHAPVVMLSGHDHQELIQDSVRHGASGFMSKAMQPDAICTEVQQWLMRSVGSLYGLTQPQPQSAIGIPMAEGDNPLTSRQYEILKYLAQGFSNKGIATKLDLSEYTVRNQVVSILRHFDAQTRTQAVASAQRAGLLPAVIVK